MSGFDKEEDFEQALIAALQRNGWEKNVLKYQTEKDLIQNWADILFENNKDIDRLNNIPLCEEEMQELLEQVKNARTPLELNGFINGESVSIIRKNPEDKLHYGKEVPLRIFGRFEIAGGQTRYQIAEQPVFGRQSKVLQDRRGDIMLLINGMPVYHIELKKSNIPVSDAYNQIEKYAHEGIYTGIFTLVQIFVAMTPEETIYFANPGPDGKFNPDFYFHWADFNNEPINDWNRIASTLLAIPLAHEMIALYTVADNADGVLKVMRSYQYRAVTRISDRVKKNDWTSGNQRGGYIWHTTGSGKTMTSFKAAQLIALSKDADKVVFLMDRVELGVQSLKEYRAFADNADDVQDTENTGALISKLKSKDPKNTLIVSSIQKMSNIRDDEVGKLRQKDLESMKSKRLVFIIDECHRSTFGDMLTTIKATFPNALFFGFTGTPVFHENEKSKSTTSDIFGNELHRYSIADGIRDGNVLGFDPTMAMVYPDNRVRQTIALWQAGAKTVQEALADPEKRKIYYHFMSEQEVPMVSCINEDGTYVKGIEDYCPKTIYETDEYQYAIVDNILENWPTLSVGGMFHALFATSSIPEAIQYYRKFKEKDPDFRVTCVFDPYIDNENAGRAIEKEEGLAEMIEDYNERYGQNFDIGSYAKFKKDVAARLAHKQPYTRVKGEDQIDLVIVVNQLLTGFDSKWINTLYLDKVLVYQNLIQAFSRTNRLFNKNDKPFGNIRYYRMPHTMKKNIEDAVKLFSGDRPQGLFADKLPDNIKHMNLTFVDMKNLFKEDGIPEMDHLPKETADKAKFAHLFREFSSYYQAAQIQGFRWDIRVYETSDSEDNKVRVEVIPTEDEYNILLQRYKELASGPRKEIVGPSISIDPYLVEQKTGAIDYNYTNSKFKKWLKQLYQKDVPKEETQATVESLHKSFAFLSQEDQEYARLFLHDVENGDVTLKEEMTLQDYISQYAAHKKNDQLKKLHAAFGIDEDKVKALLNENLTEENLNEFGRFDELMSTVVKEKARDFYTASSGTAQPAFRVNQRVRKVLHDYLLSGGKELDL